jgi:hypothetical protein
MGIKTKMALGPNPLSVKRKQKADGKDKKRRLRKGKRSKDISEARKKLMQNGNNKPSIEDLENEIRGLRESKKPSKPSAENATTLLIEAQA